VRIIVGGSIENWYDESNDSPFRVPSPLHREISADPVYLVMRESRLEVF